MVHGFAGFAIPALLVAAPFLLRRAENGLLAGIALVLVVPSSVELGPPQAASFASPSCSHWRLLRPRRPERCPDAPTCALPDLFVAGFVRCSLG